MLFPRSSPWEQVGEGESYKSKEYTLVPPKPEEKKDEKK